MATRTSPVSGDLDYVKSQPPLGIPESHHTNRAVSKGPLAVPAQPQQEHSALVHTGGSSLERDTVLQDLPAQWGTGFQERGEVLRVPLGWVSPPISEA